MSQAIATVGQIAKETQTIVITGSVSAALQGGLASIGVDHFKLGMQTADMAIEIFENGARPQEMAIQMQDEHFVVINEEMAQALGITISQQIRERMRD